MEQNKTSKTVSSKLRRSLLLVLCLTASMAGFALDYESFIVDGIGYKILSEDDHTVAVTNRAQKWVELAATSRGGGPRRLPGNYVYTTVVYSGKVVVPATVTYGGITYTVTQIGANSYGAFYDSPSVTSLTIPNTVTYMESVRYKSLKELIIEDGDTELEWDHSCSPFRGQPIERLYLGRNIRGGGYVAGISSDNYFGTSLNTLTIGDCVTELKDDLCHDCKSLTTVHFGKNINTMGDRVFSGCTSLASIDLTSKLTKIPSSAFSWCTALRTIVLPQGVTSIQDYAFSGCTGLVGISLPDGLTSIGNCAFMGAGLTKIVLPESLTSIDHYAFDDCAQLKDVIIEDGETEIGIAGPGFNNSPIDSIYVGRNMTYLGYSSWPEINKTIRAVAFGDKVTKTGKWQNFTNLTSVYFGKNIVTPEEYAFSGCTSLRHIDMTGKLTAVYYRTFYNCTALETVVLPEGATYLGGKLFEGCTSLKSIRIPGKVTEIGYYAFDGCTNLKEVVFEDGEKDLVLESYNATTTFNNCPIDSVYLGRNLEKKANSSSNSYYYYPLFPASLSKLAIGNGVTSQWNSNTFNNCTGLSKIYPLWEQPIATNKNMFPDAVYTNAALLVPAGTVKNYQATPAWNEFAHIVPTALLVTMTASEGGSVSLGDIVVTNGTNTKEVKPNSVLTFEITPEEEYYIESVVLNGEDVTAQVADGRLTPADLSEDLELTVTFAAKPYYTVTATATAGGTATVAAGSVMMGRGTTVTLTANEGHELVSVTVNGTDKTSEVTDGVLTLSNIREDQTVAATFRKLRYAITAMECENGSIHLSATEVEWGGEVVATLGGAAHYEVATVSVNGEDRTAQLDGNHLTITDVRQNITIGATFRLERFAVTATSNEGGTVLLSTDVAEWGSSVTVTVSPLSGYELVSISVDDEDVTERLTGSTYTIASVEHDTEVAAEFHLITEATIKLSAYGESTYCSDHDLDFSGVEGLKAYIASGYYPATGSVLLTRITEVPAGTGIMVKGEQGTYKVPYTETSAYFVNMFVGNVEAISINPTEGEMTNLYLTTGAGGFGFYRVTKTRTMSANRARLQLPTSLLPAEGRVGLLFEDETQGIDDLRIDDLRLDSSATYDLQGRRVDSSISKKGLYIRNGKKVVINR